MRFGWACSSFIRVLSFFGRKFVVLHFHPFFFEYSLGFLNLLEFLNDKFIIHRRIKSYPTIPLAIKVHVDVSGYKFLVGGDHVIGILGDNFSGSFQTILSLVCHCTAIFTGTFAILRDFRSSSLKTRVVKVMYSRSLLLLL